MNDSFTVLVVDDDAVDRQATRRALLAGQPPVHIAEATTCAAALAQLEGAATPDFLLLDYQLPDGTGLDVLHQIRAQGLSTPVIMLTGHGDEQVAVDLMKAGAADYLPKSAMTSESLWRCLRSVQRLRHMEEEAASARRAREETLRSSEERLRVLYGITTNSELTFDQKLNSLLENCCGQFGLEAGMIAQLIGENQVTTQAFPPDGPFRVGNVAVVQDTYCWDALRTAETTSEALSIDRADIFQWRDRPAHTLHAVQCYLGAAITLNNTPWGTLCFFSRQTRPVPFTAADREYVRLIAQWIGVEMDRLEAEEELRHSEQRYRSLVDATANIVWITSASGEVATELPQWGAFTGQTQEEYQGWGWLTAIHPEDQWQAAQAWSEALSTRHPYHVEQRLRRHDGVYRRFTARAVPVLDENGDIREWVGVHTDITERKQAEERQRFLAEAGAALASSLDYDQTLARVALLAAPLLADWCVVDLLGEDGALHRVISAHADPEKREEAREWEQAHPVDMNAPNGPPEVVRTGRSELVADIPDALLDANISDPEQLQKTRDLGMRSYLCVPLIARGRTLGAITLITAESGRQYGPADLELAEELASRAALAVDNSRLYQETRARAEREALVNKIGQALRASLDAEDILEIVTREVGEALHVGRCNLALLTPERDAFEIAPQQYVAPGIPHSGYRFPLTVFPPALLAEWKSGHTVAVSDTATDSDAAFIFPLLQSHVPLTAFLACPLFLRGEWAGQLVVHQTDGPREWTGNDAALMTAVADMLALALENARLYAREHRVADMLQAAFLPDIPDNLRGLELAKTYRSGLEEAQVGGDLYDAFPLADGRVALVIADVSGKGLGAAVQTATVKYSLRAFAAEAASPALVLRRLNHTLRAEVSGLGEHFVTLFYAVFDPRTGRLAYAAAGHETQIIKRAEGGITALDATGPILGITEHRYEQDVDCLHPGDSLILFTDGLTEARAAGTRELLDIDRVAQAVARMDRTCGAGAIVAALEHMALDWTAGRPQDDLALLVARRSLDIRNSQTEEDTAQPVTAIVSQDSQPDETLFDFTFPASADYAAEVRQAVAHWMELLGYDRRQVEDFQTAVTEAVTNAVRHGSPRGSADTFRISGYRRAAGAFIVEVADNGPGLTTTGTAVMPGPEAAGGRGLPLMHTLADEFSLLPTPVGLRLRLTKMQARPK